LAGAAERGRGIGFPRLGRNVVDVEVVDVEVDVETVRRRFGMTLRNVVVSLLVLGASLGALWWMVRPGELAVQQQEQQTFGPKPVAPPRAPDGTPAKPSRPEGAPPIAEQGPYPKAAADLTVYNFGRMAVGAEMRRVFTLRNEGEAPLKLSIGPVSCNCLSAKMSKEEVPPGDSAEIELVWFGTEYTKEYTQFAQVYTNDPAKPTMSFAVRGSCDYRLAVQPSQTWRFGEMHDGQKLVQKGFIGSPFIDSFNILRIESSSPHIQASYKPLGADEIAKRNCKSGYEIEAELTASFTAGIFAEKFVIYTDAEKEEDGVGIAMVVNVEASRPGPIRFLAATNGARWHPALNAMFLGRFAAAEGKSSIVPLFVRLAEGQTFELLDVKSSNPDLHVTVSPTEGEARVGEHTRYDLKFEVPEVPPGRPPSVHEEDNPVTVTLRTNHPDLPELSIKAYFISY